MIFSSVFNSQAGAVGRVSTAAAAERLPFSMPTNTRRVYLEPHCFPWTVLHFNKLLSRGEVNANCTR